MTAAATAVTAVLRRNRYSTRTDSPRPIKMHSQTLLTPSPDELRLIVKERHPHIGRQDFSQLPQFFLQVVGNRDGVAVGLPIDVEQDGFFPVRGDPVELGRFAGLHGSQVADLNRSLPRPANDHVLDFAGREGGCQRR